MRGVGWECVMYELVAAFRRRFIKYNLHVSCAAINVSIYSVCVPYLTYDLDKAHEWICISIYIYTLLKFAHTLQ